MKIRRNETAVQKIKYNNIGTLKVVEIFMESIRLPL